MGPSADAAPTHKAVTTELYRSAGSVAIWQAGWPQRQRDFEGLECGTHAGLSTLGSRMVRPNARACGQVRAGPGGRQTPPSYDDIQIDFSSESIAARPIWAPSRSALSSPPPSIDPQPPSTASRKDLTRWTKPAPKAILLRTRTATAQKRALVALPAQGLACTASSRTSPPPLPAAGRS